MRATSGIVCNADYQYGLRMHQGKTARGIVINDLCVMRPSIDQGMDAITSTNAD